ncbi:MAG: DUF3784 domain-containing protein [Clostridia bacterium]|nr:DUF3784 domain-containing protein [Clostridia bacterium]
MRDTVWFIGIGVLFALLGFLFICLGLQIWKKQKISLIISYHCDKVSEENKRAYCTLAGIGVLVMGVGFFLCGICTAFVRSALVFVPMTAGLVSGIALLTSAVLKYNR